MDEAVDKAQSALVAPLSAAEREQLTRLLTRVIDRRD